MQTMVEAITTGADKTMERDHIEDVIIHAGVRIDTLEIQEEQRRVEQEYVKPVHPLDRALENYELIRQFGALVNEVTVRTGNAVRFTLPRQQADQNFRDRIKEKLGRERKIGFYWRDDDLYSTGLNGGNAQYISTQRLISFWDKKAHRVETVTEIGDLGLPDIADIFRGGIATLR